MPNIVTRVLNREQAWIAPTFHEVLTVDESTLTPLGTDANGDRWFEHQQKRYGELRERRGRFSGQSVPNGIAVQYRDQDGEYWYRSFDCFAPGSYAAVEPVKPKSKARPRPIDALAPFPILAAGERRDHSSRPAARGAEAIIGRLASHDIAVSLAVDGQRLVVMAPGGRNTGIGELVDVVRPLLVPYLHGGRAYCDVTRHEALTEAQTVAGGGVPWCGACVPS
jgi:hypothetical protein